MKYKQLGNTGLIVSQLALGTMTFTSGKDTHKILGSVGQQEADKMIKKSVDVGINFFDTADIYAEGESEIILGQSFRNLGIAREEVVIASKAAGRTGMGRNDVGASRGHIMNAVEASLKRLKTDYIDLYQIHADDFLTPIEETLGSLNDLVTQGKVRYIGVSNWHAWKIADALGISERKNLARFETVQGYYSLASRDVERELAPLMEAKKMGLLVWGPLAGGLLSGRYDRHNQKAEDSRRSAVDFPIVDKERAWNIIDKIKPIAEAHGTSIASVALAWLMTRPVVTSVLVGAKRLEQLEENLEAANLELTDDEIRQLDEVSTLPPEYPGWMVDYQKRDRLGPLF
ncbi:MULTISPECIES: aldo/keto reductase [unclassified Paenibacillus]|uniref:aldo/keto reductase n=1 Tax=unclassified Paenibacillus TaxID=185978 RepID=UPI00104F2BFF|nr:MULTISPECIES: aldo/keto reductase [unclassified Paenibacillus]NIK71934.1 aryl-alcohol dehydrogenase-like predicted oxidoreductase [Paenibacillus sp. BK720]TCM96580.1 aryl-alcohol dehydrogenase-like predicted oxidoreductase [Paenibacillus sp. BK033]